MPVPTGQKLVGHVVCTVKVPIYERDELLDGKLTNWFEFRQPGIADGQIGVCNRTVELIDQHYEPVKEEEPCQSCSPS